MLKRTSAVFLILIMTAACSDLSNREQRTLSGGAIGAAGGAVAGWFFAAPLAGAAAGGALGAAVGGLSDWPDDHDDKN